VFFHHPEPHQAPQESYRPGGTGGIDMKVGAAETEQGGQLLAEVEQ